MSNDWLPEAPLIINFALTNKCNFKCKHCYSRNDPDDELDTAGARLCVESLKEAGVLSLNFGGGEPLLRKDLLEIAALAAGLGMTVSMNSNGFRLDRETAKTLKTAGFSKVGISLDSPQAEVHDGFRGVPGSFERASNALGYLNEAGIGTSISSVICRINYREIEGLIGLARKTKAGQLNFHNFKCTGLGYANKSELDLNPEEWKEFYKAALEARKNTHDLNISLDDPIISSLGESRAGSLVKGSVCGKLSLNIKTNGDITPCGFIPLVIGNILKDDLHQLWASSPVLERLRNKKPTGKCASCSNYEDCLGGCTARALALTGDINSPDPHCWK
ncbi:MAG: GeoRSP system radical SAM/SPASM protein [Nitrospiraceae bacterium]|nr:GeoRSP system radical SAM/SPASM protein [Nitrospiraceae bacterium]